MAESWDRILREVREQKTADLLRDENTPLEFGAFICWKQGRWEPEHFAPVHRVGYSEGAYAYTACGQIIPPPLMWLPLSPALVRSMTNCTRCNAEIGRLARENAA